LSCASLPPQSGIREEIGEQAHSSRIAALHQRPRLLSERTICLFRARIASGFYDRPEVIAVIAERFLAEICSPAQN
jgi:hypothetical protein